MQTLLIQNRKNKISKCRIWSCYVCIRTFIFYVFAFLCWVEHRQEAIFYYVQIQRKKSTLKESLTESNSVTEFQLVENKQGGWCTEADCFCLKETQLRNLCLVWHWNPARAIIIPYFCFLKPEGGKQACSWFVSCLKTERSKTEHQLLTPERPGMLKYIALTYNLKQLSLDKGLEAFVTGFKLYMICFRPGS